MDKMDQLSRAKGLLTQALSAALASMPNNRSVQEARMHMKKAMNELDNAAKTQTKKVSTQNDFQQWWGNVTAGVGMAAHSPISQEANHKSLNVLNGMIKQENDKLDDLEKLAVKPDPIADLLNG